MQVSSLRFVFTVSLASLWLKSQVLLYWKAEKILSLFCFVARLWLLISYSGLSKIALKATALIDLILKKVQKTQREAVPGVTEPRGRVCAVCVRCWKKGQPGQGTGWHHTGKHVRSWLFIQHTATCLCLHIKWKWLHYNYFQHIYTLLCVYICM